jgi:hypothetical protein
MGNGAHMGRGKLPSSETMTAALEELGRQVIEAVAKGEFERARQLTEAAIQQRDNGRSPPKQNLLAKAPSNS